MRRKLVYVDNFLTGHGYTPTTGVTLAKLFREEGYEVVTASSKNNKLLRLLDMVRTITANRKNSVVLIATYSTSAFYFAYLCGRVCHALNIPYIPCLHGGNLPARIAQSPALSASFFGKSRQNVAVSGYLKQSLDENRWTSVIIPNNINIDSYPFTLRTNCRPKLLWVRSFHKIYNPLLAIEVAAELRKTYPDVKLTMVGPDKDGSLAICKERIAELRLEDTVELTGLLSRDEWVRLAASHDIFINTTDFDNLPVSVVEAMALGMPVISTKVGGVPYLIENGSDGFLVSKGSKSEFIAAINTLIGKPWVAEQISKRAREKAETFDRERVKVLWRELLSSVA